MGIFGRKRPRTGGRHAAASGRRGSETAGEPAEEASGETEPAASRSADTAAGEVPAGETAGGGSDAVPPHEGPYDATEVPKDSVPRMDLGSVRVPVPRGAQVQVEMDQSSGQVRAVHVVTEHGQVTVSAYAAPRSGRLWPEVSRELSEQLREGGATVARSTGPWGPELSVRTGSKALYFVGVDGPRWMVRGVIARPEQLAEAAPETLRSLLRDTIVARGEGPMPVRNPLPIKLPEAVANHIAQQNQQAGQQEGAQQAGAQQAGAQQAGAGPQPQQAQPEDTQPEDTQPEDTQPEDTQPEQTEQHQSPPRG